MGSSVLDSKDLYGKKQENMRWKQIYYLSDLDDKAGQLLYLLKRVEESKKRPAFFGVRYISPRYFRQSIPSKLVFLASVFNLLSQYVAIDITPKLAAFSIFVNFILVGGLMAFRVHRLARQIA